MSDNFFVEQADKILALEHLRPNWKTAKAIAKEIKETAECCIVPEFKPFEKDSYKNRIDICREIEDIFNHQGYDTLFEAHETLQKVLNILEANVNSQ